MKICTITCYNDPDYIRARTLRNAAERTRGVELIVVKNRHKDLLRYFEVLIRVLAVRVKYRPDAYILTFRGYELLLPVRLLTIGKPLIYDEFINPIEWAALEHKKISDKGLIAKIIKLIYKLSLTGKYHIITDTESHADLSSKIMNIPRQKYSAVYVGTDESVFTAKKAFKKDKGDFKVFYYGNMLPLHGISYVIEAAQILRGKPITFELVGGSSKVAEDVMRAQMAGAKIEYKKWVTFETLPKMMMDADLCLAGPFGKTVQSNYVITGKAYQYLAMGRPVVIGKNKESHIFTDKKNALLVEQASAKSLADAIIWAYEHRTILADIGKSGRKLYESEFSVDKVGHQLKRALHKVID